MNPDKLALNTLAWAYGSIQTMPQDQRREVRQAIRQSRLANQESPYRRRLRLWGLGPRWGKFA